MPGASTAIVASIPITIPTLVWVADPLAPGTVGSQIPSMAAIMIVTVAAIAAPVPMVGTMLVGPVAAMPVDVPAFVAVWLPIVV